MTLIADILHWLLKQKGYLESCIERIEDYE